MPERAESDQAYSHEVQPCFGRPLVRPVPNGGKDDSRSERAVVILGFDPRICGRAHVVDMVTFFPRQQMLGSSPSKTTRDAPSVSSSRRTGIKPSPGLVGGSIGPSIAAARLFSRAAGPISPRAASCSWPSASDYSRGAVRHRHTSSRRPCSRMTVGQSAKSRGNRWDRRLERKAKGSRRIRSPAPRDQALVHPDASATSWRRPATRQTTGKTSLLQLICAP